MPNHKDILNINGNVIGSYTVADKMTTAHHPSGATKSTQIGNLNPEWLARELIRAIERDLENS